MTRALDKAASRWGQAGIFNGGGFRGVLQATPLPEAPHDAGCTCDRCIVDKLREDLTMAVICHMVASRAVADDKGDDHGPFEVH